MKFRAHEYYQASLQRMKQALAIYRQGESFALAIYCGGLAVECLLRAFRWTEDANFDGRHDLSELLRTSGLLRIDEDYMRRKGESDATIRESGIQLHSAMNEVMILWHNNLRYASEASLRAFLNRMDKLSGIKGDPLKKNAADLLNAAQTVIDRGVTLWT